MDRGDSAILNAELLPPDYYALPEQIAGGLGPDVLTLQLPTEVAPRCLNRAMVRFKK